MNILCAPTIISPIYNRANTITYQSFLLSKDLLTQINGGSIPVRRIVLLTNPAKIVGLVLNEAI